MAYIGRDTLRNYPTAFNPYVFSQDREMPLPGSYPRHYNYPVGGQTSGLNQYTRYPHTYQPLNLRPFQRSRHRNQSLGVPPVQRYPHQDPSASSSDSSEARITDHEHIPSNVKELVEFFLNPTSKLLTRKFMIGLLHAYNNQLDKDEVRLRFESPTDSDLAFEKAVEERLASGMEMEVLEDRLTDLVDRYNTAENDSNTAGHELLKLASSLFTAACTVCKVQGEMLLREAMGATTLSTRTKEGQPSNVNAETKKQIEELLNEAERLCAKPDEDTVSESSYGSETSTDDLIDLGPSDLKARELRDLLILCYLSDVQIKKKTQTILRQIVMYADGFQQPARRSAYIRQRRLRVPRTYPYENTWVSDCAAEYLAQVISENSKIKDCISDLARKILSVDQKGVDTEEEKATKVMARSLMIIEKLLLLSPRLSIFDSTWPKSLADLIAGVDGANKKFEELFQPVLGSEGDWTQTYLDSQFYDFGKALTRSGTAGNSWMSDQMGIWIEEICCSSKGAQSSMDNSNKSKAKGGHESNLDGSKGT